MSIFSRVLWRARRAFPGLRTKQSKQRKRLQKAQNKTAFPRDDIIIAFRAQSCPPLRLHNGAVGGGVRQEQDLYKTQAHQPYGNHIESRKPQLNLPNGSVNSFSIYPFDEMAVEILKRTRAKTPCFWVGQLDQKPQDERCDSAIALAGEYQALLPPRTFTPGLETQEVGKKARRMRGRQSLRGLTEVEEPMSPIYSDCETLVGSETPPWPPAPMSGYSRVEKSRSCQAKHHDQYLEDKTDVGFQLSLNLLTEQLATGLFKKHPAEEMDRASSLQVLLMIEAYESVQQHIREGRSDPRLASHDFEHTRDIEQMLEHWLQALRSMYSQTKAGESVPNLHSSLLSSSTTLSSLALGV